MIALMIWIGVHPAPFLERMEPSVQVVLERVEGARLDLGAAQQDADAEQRAVSAPASPATRDRATEGPVASLAGTPARED